MIVNFKQDMITMLIKNFEDKIRNGYHSIIWNFIMLVECDGWYKF